MNKYAGFGVGLFLGNSFAHPLIVGGPWWDGMFIGAIAAPIGIVLLLLFNRPQPEPPGSLNGD